LAFTPEAQSQEADSLAYDEPFIFFGVSGGVDFNEFMASEKEDLVLSGTIAYLMSSGIYIEYDQTLIGDDLDASPQGKLGYQFLNDDDFNLFGGLGVAKIPEVDDVEADEKVYAWGSMLVNLAPRHFVRVTLEAGEGGAATKIGYVISP
jgi:hypothetical protein